MKEEKIYPPPELEPWSPVLKSECATKELHFAPFAIKGFKKCLILNDSVKTH